MTKKSKTIPYIGLASGLGGSHPGSGEGPLLIQHHTPQEDWKTMVLPDPSIKDKLEQIAHLNQQLAQATFKAAQEHPSQIIIGGDHSCAIGTWSGIAEANRLKHQDIAVLWFDAHMDSHTLDTSPSGNPHGMPLAALLGHGSPKFTQILSKQPKLKPENVFLIGIRSFEPPEQVLLEKLKVRIYYIEEVHQRGLSAILKEIFANLAERAVPYGISMDIDFFDPQTMPATGTPEPLGIDPEEFFQTESLLKANPPIAFEFVEFNPPLDRGGRSLHCVQRILQMIKPVLPA